MIGSEYTCRKRICIVATFSHAIKVFMRAHIKLLSEEYDVTLVAKGSADDLSELLGNNVSFIPLQIERKISIKNDVLSLINLWRLFRKEKYDCVHSIMPKSGLLSMLAARLAGVPLRFHTFTGQVWATKRGGGRLLLKFLDKVLAMNATRILADSQSQRLFLIKNKIAKISEVEVLADGSIAGVDTNRFKYKASARQQIRLKYNIPADAMVFLFVGRLTRDKGLVNLSQAFSVVAKQKENTYLLIVGPDEGNLSAELTAFSQCLPGRVHKVGFTDYPEDFMSAADILCLASYREGFGSVLIEAASVGLPAIASRIYGVIDAVEDGVTGILHHPSSDNEIVDAMLLFASNDKLRIQMGAAARERAVNKFSEERVTKAFLNFYHEMFLTGVKN